MTIGELIKHLERYEPETEVLVQDADDNVWEMVPYLYEDDDIDHVYVVAAKDKARVRWVDTPQRSAQPVTSKEKR